MNIKFLITGTFLLFSHVVCAQSSRDSLLMNQSKAITNRIKDSLGLSAIEYQGLLAINYQLLKRKTDLMLGGGERSELRRQIQKAENTRDSMFKLVIPAVKFDRYVKIKPFLLVTQ